MFIREVKEASTHQKELVSMVMLRQEGLMAMPLPVHFTAPHQPTCCAFADYLVSWGAGLVTYKRTLKRALTSNDSASRRVKRSRQQRLWEKRCQVLKEDEKQLWGDIKPTMMSEEESDDQNAQTLQRRRPSWRSDRLLK
eukprot:Em0001g2778a